MPKPHENESSELVQANARPIVLPTAPELSVSYLRLATYEYSPLCRCTLSYVVPDQIQRSSAKCLARLALIQLSDQPVGYPLLPSLARSLPFLLPSFCNSPPVLLLEALFAILAGLENPAQACQVPLY